MILRLIVIKVFLDLTNSIFISPLFMIIPLFVFLHAIPNRKWPSLFLQVSCLFEMGCSFVVRKECIHLSHFAPSWSDWEFWMHQQWNCKMVCEDISVPCVANDSDMNKMSVCDASRCAFLSSPGESGTGVRWFPAATLACEIGPWGHTKSSLKNVILRYLSK
jgi:hypothetical protein